MAEAETPKEEKKEDKRGTKIVFNESRKFGRSNEYEVEINLLKDSEYNPRSVSEEEWNNIKASIHKFGVVDPLIVNGSEERKNIVIGGHLRLKVAKALGLVKVPVVYVNIPDLRTEQELNLRLNNNTGHNDLDLLANLDGELLEEVGLKPEELFNLDDEIPTLEDVIFEDFYEPNWVVIRFDDTLRNKILEVVEPLTKMKGVKIDVAKDG